MSFSNSQSYRCLKSVCLWSFLGIMVIVLCFFVGYFATCIAGLIKDSSFAQGLGWIIIVVPTILLTLLFMICFAIANGFLLFILYKEYVKKSSNLPMLVVEKTETVFNKIIKKDIIKIIIGISALILYLLSVFIYIIYFYAIFVSLITFAILLIIYKK